MVHACKAEDMAKAAPRCTHQRNHIRPRPADHKITLGIETLTCTYLQFRDMMRTVVTSGMSPSSCSDLNRTVGHHLAHVAAVQLHPVGIQAVSSPSCVKVACLYLRLKLHGWNGLRTMGQLP